MRNESYNEFCMFSLVSLLSTTILRTFSPPTLRTDRVSLDYYYYNCTHAQSSHACNC